MGTAKSFGYSAFSFPSNAWRAASGIMKEAGYNAIRALAIVRGEHAQLTISGEHL